MEKQSFELITRVAKFTKVHKLVYDASTSRTYFFLSLRSRVKKILKDNPQISLIHLNDGLMVAATLWLKKITNIPVVATVHGLDIVFPLKWYQRYIIPKFNHLDRIIAVSRSTANECIKRGIDKSKIEVINNGVELNIPETAIDFDVKDYLNINHKIELGQRKIVLALGRSVKRKGFSWFIKNVVPRMDDDCIFIMIGPFKKEGWLKRIVIQSLPKSLWSNLSLFLGYPTDQMEIAELLEKNENENKVVHLSKVAFPVLLAFLKRADVFVMPNRKIEGDIEGFGLVALEAVLSSTPVIANGIEGITDAIQNNKNGFLIEGDSINEWINHINKVTRNEIDVEAFAESAMEYTSKKFSWDKMSKEYFDCFKRIESNALINTPKLKEEKTLQASVV